MFQERFDENWAKLAFEAEIVGDIPRAYDMYERRLSLYKNEYNEELYFQFARFVCRNAYCNPAEELEPADKAKELLLKAVSLNGDGANGAKGHVVKFLGCLLLQQEMYEESTALFVLDLDPMKMDRITAFFLSILYAYKQETESATKYLALARKPEFLFRGYGLFYKKVTFKALLALAAEDDKKKAEADGNEYAPESDSDSDKSSDSGLDDEEAVQLAQEEEEEEEEEEE